MATITQDALETVTRRLVATLKPQRIYLFGSHAYGTPGPDSDLDLLLVVPKLVGRRVEISRAARKLIGDVGCGVDVLVRTCDEFDRRSSWRSNFEATVRSKGRLLHG